MKQRQQSSTSYPITFLMVDSADHVTGKTGLTPTVTISKNGGSFAAPSGSVTEIGNGLYALAGNATDRNTLGELNLHAEASGADPTDDRYVIVPWNPFDAVRLGLTAIPNATPNAAGGMLVTAAGTLDVDTLLSRLDAAVSTRSTLTQTQVTGGAYALQTDASGYVKISAGTGTGQLSLSSGKVSLSSSQTFDLTGNITGNLSGSVGSVTTLPTIDGLTYASWGKVILAALAGETDASTPGVIEFKDQSGNVVLTLTYGVTEGERTGSVIA